LPFTNRIKCEGVMSPFCRYRGIVLAVLIPWLGVKFFANRLLWRHIRSRPMKARRSRRGAWSRYSR
jgi:hypothetical protein